MYQPTKKKARSSPSRVDPSPLTLQQNSPTEIMIGAESDEMAASNVSHNDSTTTTTLLPTGQSHQSSSHVAISPRINEFSARTWWMVDLQQQEQHQQQQPQQQHHDDNDDGITYTKQGATPLVKLCMTIYNWDLVKTRKVLIAYRQFLTLVKEMQDWDANFLKPCELVDEMWHLHVGDVINYCHDMMLLCGRVVGRDPHCHYNDASRLEMRVRRTRDLIRERFGAACDEEIWGVDQDIHEGDEISISDIDENYESTAMNNNNGVANTTKDSDGEEQNCTSVADNCKVVTSHILTIRMDDPNDHNNNVREENYCINPSAVIGETFCSFSELVGINRSELKFMLNGKVLGGCEVVRDIDLEEIDLITVVYDPQHESNENSNEKTDATMLYEGAF